MIPKPHVCDVYAVFSEYPMKGREVLDWYVKGNLIQ